MLSLSHQNIPIAIIGGGIHGISIAMRLIRDRPQAAKHLVVLDRHPQPLTAWCRKTEGQGMTVLRSPAVHHIDTEPLGIVEYARSADRLNELAPPYAQPSTALFLDFCRHEIEQHGIEQVYYPFDVATLRWDKGSGRFPFRIISQRNEGFRARCVILATGSEDFPYIPTEFVAWQRRFPKRVLHSCNFNLQALAQAEIGCSHTKIVIVGGGLTAGTLAKNLVELGKQVVLLTRKPLKIQQFDFEPLWVGPKALGEFRRESDWEKRYEIIQQVRGEGSMTSEIAEGLMKHTVGRDPAVSLYSEASILQIDQPNKLRIQTTKGAIDDADLLILATGYRFGLRHYPFLSGLIKQHAIPILHGLPLLDESLQLRPVENLFGSGVIAQLQIGPASGNIVGATLAYDRFRQNLLREIPTSY
jgi:hypothetical protein